jgi:hypothetical protein
MSLNTASTSESTQESTLAFYWSGRALCRRVGDGVAMLGLSTLALQLAGLIWDRSGTASGFLIFVALALPFTVIGLWLLFPAVDKLTHPNRPGIALSGKGLTIDSYLTTYAWRQLLKAELVTHKGGGETVHHLFLYFRELPTHKKVDVSALRADMRYLLESINQAAHGKRPWRNPRLYTPNVIPTVDRRGYILWSALLIVYASWGVWLDDVFIPSRRGGGMHFHGHAALAMGAALVFAAITFVIEVIDHFDRRNNEHWYDRYSCVAIIAGWVLAIAAMFLRLASKA